jgi:DNA-binding CsgD family transcriptional regulator
MVNVGKESQPSAFVLFRQSKGSKVELSYNEKAWRILTFSLSPSEDDPDPLSIVYAYCSKWAKTLNRGTSAHKSGESLSPATGFIDIIESGRRRYGVRGVVLAGHPAKQRQYLFILERTSLESAPLEILFRHYHLNNREKEIVRLLLAGNSNKEIADSLGLTLNTVKGYMKLLTRKLGVSGRSGIVAVFVAK